MIFILQNTVDITELVRFARSPEVRDRCRRRRRRFFSERARIEEAYRTSRSQQLDRFRQPVRTGTGPRSRFCAARITSSPLPTLPIVSSPETANCADCRRARSSRRQKRGAFSNCSIGSMRPAKRSKAPGIRVLASYPKRRKARAFPRVSFHPVRRRPGGRSRHLRSRVRPNGKRAGPYTGNGS